MEFPLSRIGEKDEDDDGKASLMPSKVFSASFGLSTSQKCHRKAKDGRGNVGSLGLTTPAGLLGKNYPKPKFSTTPEKNTHSSIFSCLIVWFSLALSISALTLSLLTSMKQHCECNAGTSHELGPSASMQVQDNHESDIIRTFNQKMDSQRISFDEKIQLIVQNFSIQIHQAKAQQKIVNDNVDTEIAFVKSDYGKEISLLDKKVNETKQQLNHQISSFVQSILQTMQENQLSSDVADEKLAIQMNSTTASLEESDSRLYDVIEELKNHHQANNEEHLNRLATLKKNFEQENDQLRGNFNGSVEELLAEINILELTTESTAFALNETQHDLQQTRRSLEDQRMETDAKFNETHLTIMYELQQLEQTFWEKHEKAANELNNTKAVFYEVFNQLNRQLNQTEEKMESDQKVTNALINETVVELSRTHHKLTDTQQRLEEVSRNATSDNLKLMARMSETILLFTTNISSLQENVENRYDRFQKNLRQQFEFVGNKSQIVQTQLEVLEEAVDNIRRHFSEEINETNFNMVTNIERLTAKNLEIKAHLNDTRSFVVSGVQRLKDDATESNEIIAEKLYQLQNFSNNATLGLQSELDAMKVVLENLIQTTDDKINNTNSNVAATGLELKHIQEQLNLTVGRQNGTAPAAVVDKNEAFQMLADQIALLFETINEKENNTIELINSTNAVLKSQMQALQVNLQSVNSSFQSFQLEATERMRETNRYIAATSYNFIQHLNLTTHRFERKDYILMTRLNRTRIVLEDRILSLYQLVNINESQSVEQIYPTKKFFNTQVEQLQEDLVTLDVKLDLFQREFATKINKTATSVSSTDSLVRDVEQRLNHSVIGLERKDLTLAAQINASRSTLERQMDLAHQDLRDTDSQHARELNFTYSSLERTWQRLETRINTISRDLNTTLNVTLQNIRVEQNNTLARLSSMKIGLRPSSHAVGNDSLNLDDYLMNEIIKLTSFVKTVQRNLTEDINAIQFIQTMHQHSLEMETSSREPSITNTSSVSEPGHSDQRQCTDLDQDVNSTDHDVKRAFQCIQTILTSSSTLQREVEYNTTRISAQIQALYMAKEASERSLASLTYNYNRLQRSVSACSYLADVPNCSPGYKGNAFSGTCYKLIRSHMSWHRAKTYCQNYGSQLATFPNTESVAWLSNLLLTNPEWSTGDIWLGGYYAAGRWKWQGKLTTAVNSTLWAPGQPSGSGLCTDSRRSQGYSLFKHNCGYSQPFVCEKPSL